MSLTSATVATADISDNMRQHTFANVVPLTVRRFGMPPACALGAYVGRDLLLTSYQAIRGGDDIAAGVAGAPRVTVAAYDVAADLAVLRVAGARTDSIALATAIADGQSLWGVRLADCRAPSDLRTRVVTWTGRPSGRLQLGDTPTDAPTGTVFVDREGRLAGVWAGGSAAIPAPGVVALIQQARGASAQASSVQDVSRRENHAYGSVVIAANITGATINVTQVEPWHWEGLATASPAPLTFVGPMGRYRVLATTASGGRSEQFVVVRPGAQERVVISERTLAGGTEPTGPVVAKRRSKLPWILGGVGGVGVLAAVALGGGGGGGDKTTGGISVQIPVNP